MRYIEGTCSLTYSSMFCKDTCVLEGHLPPGKGHKPGLEGQVIGIKGSPVEAANSAYQLLLVLRLGLA